jgi:hypothetical protein
MLHLYIVHRALDVKHPRPVCKVCQHGAFFFRCGIRHPGVVLDLSNSLELVSGQQHRRLHKHSQHIEKTKSRPLGPGRKTSCCINSSRSEDAASNQDGPFARSVNTAPTRSS